MSSSTNSPAIEGFDEELAEELQSRATEALERQEEAIAQERRALGVEDALAEMPHLTEAMLVTLGKAGIKTLDDLADLATDELIAKKRDANRAAAIGTDGPPMRRNARSRRQGRRAGRIWPDAKSRATRSSWPPARTGSKMKTSLRPIRGGRRCGLLPMSA